MVSTPRLNLFQPAPTDLANVSTIINAQYDIIDNIGITSVVDALPGAGSYDGQLFFLRPTGVLWKWNLSDISWYYVGSKYKALGVLGFKTVNNILVSDYEEILAAKALIAPSPDGLRKYKAAWSLTMEQEGSTINNPGDTQIRLRLSNRYDDINNGDPLLVEDYCDMHDNGIAGCPQMFAGEFVFTPLQVWQTCGIYVRRGNENSAIIRVNAGGYDSFYVEDLGVEL